MLDTHCLLPSAPHVVCLHLQALLAWSAWACTQEMQRHLSAWILLHAQSALLCIPPLSRLTYFSPFDKAGSLRDLSS